MSEANLPPHDPVPSQSGQHAAKRERRSQPHGSDTHRPGDTHLTGDDGWQAIPLPHVIQPGDLAVASGDPLGASKREQELLSLVHDLNACNDQLLQRVSQLEESLEISQTALQAEIARSQDPATPQPPQSPHPQIAQLISDLDYAQHDLKQQRVLNETLKAQLAASHEQITQLERECALLRQQDSEKSQALTDADTTCRDLRIRLQRQQRYTLQFKVALEKSLEVANHRSNPAAYGQANDAASAPPATVVAEPAPNPITMPKSQRIQPWSADALPVQADQTLDALIQGMGMKSVASPASTPPSIAPIRDDASRSRQPIGKQGVTTQQDDGDPEAETVLWKDLERVVKAPPRVTPEALSTAAGFDEKSADAASEKSAASASCAAKPSLQPSSSEPPAPTRDDSDPLVIETLMSNPATNPSSNPVQGSSSPQPPASPQFTEPSPWGAPLPTPTASHASPDAQPSNAQPPDAAQAVGQRPETAPPSPVEVPTGQTHPADLKKMIESALMGRANGSSGAAAPTGLPPMLRQPGTTASPSPIVHPLRPQKKIKSLSAVQLPNFPRQKAQ